MKQLNDDIFRLLSSSQRPIKIVHHYDQKDTPYCIYFALAGMLGYNTGDVMPDEKIVELGKKLKPWKLHARMPQIIKLLSPFYDCYTIRDDWSEVLERGWAIQIYIRPTKEFWIDALDGDIDNYQLPWDGLDHSVYIHKTDWKILIENSWANIPTIDITGKLEQLRKDNVIPWAGYVFTRKNN